jgi:uncharacterized protein DUF4258
MEGLSLHARIRMQQRAISPAVLEDVLAYGREVHDHQGATILYLDKRARQRIAPQKRTRTKRLDVYVVIGPDGLIKTVGHRYRRIRRT